MNYRILLVLLMLNACVNKNEVKLVSKNFEAEVEQQQNLVFTFDRDLVADSMTGRWDTIQYIKFTPEVAGKFKWNGKRELVFSPIVGFKPSTDYKASLTNNIVSNLGSGYQVKKEDFAFHTSYLRLESATGYWELSSKFQGQASLSIVLNLNNDIEPSQLKSLLHLEVNKQPSEFTLGSASVSRLITVTVDNLNKENIQNTPVKINLAKGVKVAGSEFLTKEDQELSIIVSSPERVFISQVLGEYIGTEPVIHVYTNQPVDDNSLSKLITLDPKIAVKIEKTADGFYLKGPFTAGLSYQLTISKALKGAIGGTMENDFTQLIPFGALEPMLSFVAKSGMYLSSNSSKNVAINVVNIPNVHVTIRKIYENNIIHFLHNNRGGSYDYYEEEEYEGDYEGDYPSYRYRYSTYSDYNMELYGDVVFDRSYDTRDLPKQNGVQLLNLSFDEQNTYKGIYLVNISSSDAQYKRDTKLISISDIGLITKKTNEEFYVFANSIKTAKPISGASVSFISSNNQTLYTATTDGDGVAVFRNVNVKSPNFYVSMITAKAGADFNFLNLNDSRVNDSRFDVGGRRADQSGCMAFLYGDRNIYRPGENIYLNTIVLDESWKPVGPVPVKIKLLRPDGKEFKTVRGTLNKEGAFTTSFTLPVATVTGTYIAEVFSANDILLESKAISVEEFMPDRIDVKLELNKTDFSPDDTIIANIKATNLFGPPAADRKYEAELALSYKYFYSKSFPGYTFGISGTKRQEFPKVLREGRTNSQGLAKEIFEIDESYSGIGVLEGKMFSTVFDETGRPVNRVKRFDIFTQKVFYGVKMSDYYVNAKDKTSIPVIAVNKDGKAVASKAQVRIIRHDWYTVLERNDYGNYRYVSHQNDRIMFDQVVDIPTSGYILSYIPRESGSFEVRVNDPDNDHYVSSTFYAYGWGYTQNTSFQVNTEGEVDIKPDKEKYNPGDVANILFTTPFAGRLLVTVECDKVLEYFYINTDKKSASLKLPVKESYLPNVYITATLFRPLDDGAIPLTVGHGFAPLIVNPDKNRLPVTIVAPAQSRSKTKQTITVKTRAEQNVELTVAVVDEGILQLKNFETPDPYKFFYQKKALNVTAYDLYPSLLPDLKLKKSSTGGDGMDLEKRVNPLPNKRVKLVAFWSGILHTNAAGEATYTIDIPQFSGDLRVMVCAYKNKSFGSADAHIKVADPVVISPSIPRFLSPRDTLVMPVTFSNTTKKPMQVLTSVAVEGALKVLGVANTTIEIKEGGEQRVEYKILAATAIGLGSITINAKTASEVFTDKTDITVRPSTSLLKVNEAGVVKGNSSKMIELKTDFIPSTMESKLIVSQNPMIQFTKQLNYILGYPYGCLEQTTSKAFPQIYYTELVKNVKDAQYTTTNPQYFVQEGIRKIEGMQIYNGGFSYWPGGEYQSWWSTVYATHFLMECKKAAYEVNENVVERCISYIGAMTKEHQTETYWYWDDSNTLRSKTIAKKENAYSLYIMALYGKPDVSSMNYYKSNIPLLALDSRYLLACTYLAIGDRKSYAEILPKAFEGERSRNCFGGSFYSFVRDEAIALNALLENDPDNPQIGTMVRHLTQAMVKDPYLNTQEQAFTFLALGKFMKRQNENKVTADIMIDNKKVGEFKGDEIKLKKGISGKVIKIDVKGTGNLYYFFETEGLSAKSEFKEEDSFLKVRKSFYNRFGQPANIRDIKQGDLIAVKLSVQNTERTTVENVVVTDMLPAGFEIENPRIGEIQEMSWVKDESQPDYFDVRDDRINFFTTADANVRNFYYLVRAVSTGNYVMGPVGADAMYNGEYHSYNGAGVVRIK